MRARSGGFAVLGLVLALLPASATATTRDPLTPGPHEARVLTYDAGTLSLTVHQEDGSDARFEQPLEGSVTHPSGEGPWPVALFLHGRHATCIGPDGTEFVPDSEEDSSCEEGETLRTRIRNYAGYAYIARYLASHGYAVVSPSANVIASFDGLAPDGGAAARAQVIGTTLDLMREWDRESGPSEVGSRLVGELDLGAIVLMGHSRGGEAVSEFIAANQVRERPYPLAGVLALAPTDISGLNPLRRGLGTNFAALLPGCDGDVVDLDGGRTFERAKYGSGGAHFEKYQWLLQGANHNWFNTVWKEDDVPPSLPPVRGDSACSRASQNDVRLDRGTQRAAGIALIGGFVRRFAGGESGFGPLFRGQGWPRAACRRGSPLRCRATLETSYVAPEGLRRTIIRPGGQGPARENALGGRIHRRGPARLGWCDPTADEEGQRRRCPGPEESFELLVNRSHTKQLVVSWGGRSALRTDLREAGDASVYRDLTLRAATTLSPRNPAARANRAGRATQRFDVVLEDRDGRRTRVAAERFSTAIAPSVGDSFRNILLSDVRIPLSRFGGVDLARLRALELRFGVRGRRSGQVQIADVAFQR